MEFRLFVESTAVELYNSAVKAFPATTKRQHAVDPVEISNLKILPFRGMKTLYFKTEAKNEGRVYQPVVIFKNVNYQSSEYSLTASDGLVYTLQRPSLAENHVLVRCPCSDFRWRFSYYNHLDNSLQGRKPPKYEGTGPAANPMEKPGLCKHLMKMISELNANGLIKD